MLGRALILAASFALLAAPAGAAPSDPDPSYGVDGVALVDAYQIVRGAAATPDGGIVVMSDAFSVTKLTPIGALDRSFGADGTATAPLPAPQTSHRAHRLLRRGGLTVRLALPTGTRLTVALRRLRAPHMTVARGNASARPGARGEHHGDDAGCGEPLATRTRPW